MSIYININRKGKTPPKGGLVAGLENAPILMGFLKSKGVTPEPTLVYDMNLGKKAYKSTYILQDIYEACDITDEKHFDLSSDMPAPAVAELKSLIASLNSGWNKKKVSEAFQELTQQNYKDDYRYLVEGALKDKVKEVLYADALELKNKELLYEDASPLSKRSVENLVSSRLRKHFKLKIREDIVGENIAYVVKFIDDIDAFSIASKAKRILQCHL